MGERSVGPDALRLTVSVQVDGLSRPTVRPFCSEFYVLLEVYIFREVSHYRRGSDDTFLCTVVLYHVLSSLSKYYRFSTFVENESLPLGGRGLSKHNILTLRQG